VVPVMQKQHNEMRGDGPRRRDVRGDHHVDDEGRLRLSTTVVLVRVAQRRQLFFEPRRGRGVRRGAQWGLSRKPSSLALGSSMSWTALNQNYVKKYLVLPSNKRCKSGGQRAELTGLN
jgi:hypothetical protein